MMSKIDGLRADIRRAEKLRRELEVRIDEAQAEAGKERKLRERSEEYCKQMEEEMEKLRQRSAVAGEGTGLGLSPVSQEINRLVTLILLWMSCSLEQSFYLFKKKKKKKRKGKEM
jgi:serine/threonine-protein kinase MRCK